MAETTAGRDEAELRELFAAELRVAGLRVPDDDRERLFAMWVDHLPNRDALRAAALRPEEEPILMEKAATLPPVGGPS